MRYGKEPTSYAQQLEQLKRRGLQVADDASATRYLQRVGYYRMMGYLLPFRFHGRDEFRAGASFEEAARYYEFDHALRLHVMDAIGHIEVALRTALAHRIGHAYGAFGHANPSCFARAPGWHAAWMQGFDDDVRRAREPFLDHYRARYDEPPFPRVPIWMALEVTSLGKLSRLLGALHKHDQKAVAERFGLPAPVFVSWLHAISVVRNIAAHHGRLWNRVLGVKPMRPRHGDWQTADRMIPNDRTYFMLLVLKTLLSHMGGDLVGWRSQVADRMRSMAGRGEFRQGMGVPLHRADDPL